MSDDNYKRITRLLVLSVILWLVLAIAVVAYVAYTHADIKRSIGSISIPELPSLEPLKQELATIRPKDGINGENGVDGTSGLDGVSVQGPKGEKGENGVDGKSAYDLWLLAGNIGSIQDYLISLRGNDGANGRTPQFAQEELSKELLVKYEGDTLWTPVETVCLNCEAQ